MEMQEKHGRFLTMITTLHMTYIIRSIINPRATHHKMITMNKHRVITTIRRTTLKEVSEAIATGVNLKIIGEAACPASIQVMVAKALHGMECWTEAEKSRL